ncbi:MAG TPA: hypothetical protein VG650_12220 [Mycobacteriales bacterium]|nr:hypothetical protein [Mycobacteriales bacterium]
MIVAIVLAFAMMPALALGTGSYVRSTTGTELQRASDTGALAGAAEIPLGDINFAENYISQIQGTAGVVKTLQALGIQNYAQLPDPLTDACKVALADASNSNNLADAYTTYDKNAWCKAVYLPDAGVLGSAGTCLNSISGLSSLTTGLGSLLGLLGLGALSPTKLLAALQSTLPGLLRPAIQVTTSWHVNAPFDSIFNSGGSTQTSVSVARRLFKNAVVLPTIPIGGATVNVNPTLQITRTALLSTLTSVEGVLNTLNALVPGIGSCAAVIDNLSGDLADAVDPPNNGPSLTTILADAAASNSPVVAVSTAVTGLGIPFLDMVPVCIESVNGQYVAHLTSFGSCIINGPGAFRAALRNS